MVSDAPVQVIEDAEHGRVQLVLTGRVTVSEAGQFHKTARELSARGTDVTVSCERAEYLDVSAVQILLCLGRDLIGRGRRCDIVGVSEPLGEYFRLAGLAGPR
jgi:anti-anti-sigma regulatory factor